MSEEVNAARYARILFLIGQFNHGLYELLNADYLVEAAHFGIVLQELGLVSTRQGLIKLLSS